MQRRLLLERFRLSRSGAALRLLNLFTEKSSPFAQKCFPFNQKCCSFHPKQWAFSHTAPKIASNKTLFVAITTLSVANTTRFL